MCSYLPLALAHHGHRVPDQAEQETARSCTGPGQAPSRRGQCSGSGLAVDPAQVPEQVERVDKDVVVSFEHVPGVRAVARDPAQSRHALVRQVLIRVLKVLPTYTHETN